MSGGIDVREMADADVERASLVCHAAFNQLNEALGFPPEFPPLEVINVPRSILRNCTSPGFKGFVAVGGDGEILGSNLVDLRDGVAGIGPISVDPTTSGRSVGKALMKAVMGAAEEAGVKSVRLMQFATNTRSFSLYLGLGFNPAATLAEYQGSCTAEAPGGLACAPLDTAAVCECSALHEAVVGTPRAEEIGGFVDGPFPNCVVRDASGAVVAYTTATAKLGHTVAASEEALAALLVHQSSATAAAQDAGAPLPPVACFVPHDRPRVLRWLAANGFRLTRSFTLMSYGNHPKVSDAGIYLPSIMY